MKILIFLVGCGLCPEFAKAKKDHQTRVGTIRLSTDMIHIAIRAVLYDSYHDIPMQ